jgi:hypothetical protein
VRYGLSIGAACVPFLLGLMYLFAPIAYPIAKLLDWVLGEGESHTYKKVYSVAPYPCLFLLFRPPSLFLYMLSLLLLDELDSPFSFPLFSLRC